ncbi:hypothetical protein ACRALDRAFT_2024995 [Sodiomyces alcalophilus JCM 7366]|uniref:uncharacterized protein n=1 Tax=Sodiomyces alcalophilus JCM 7366 TaxID=591952 RepID=UPI0039B52259
MSAACTWCGVAVVESALLCSLILYPAVLLSVSFVLHFLTPSTPTSLINYTSSRPALLNEYLCMLGVRSSSNLARTRYSVFAHSNLDVPKRGTQGRAPKIQKPSLSFSCLNLPPPLFFSHLTCRHGELVDLTFWAFQHYEFPHPSPLNFPHPP